MKIITDKVKQKTLHYNSSYDKDAFIIITEWANMEGYDIASSHGKGNPTMFSMCHEELTALRALIAAFDLGEECGGGNTTERVEEQIEWLEKAIEGKSIHEQIISRINKLDEDTREAKGNLDILVLDKFLEDIRKLAGE